jgi:hypothetical protein
MAVHQHIQHYSSSFIEQEAIPIARQQGESVPAIEIKPGNKCGGIRIQEKIPRRTPLFEMQHSSSLARNFSFGRIFRKMGVDGCDLIPIVLKLAWHDSLRQQLQSRFGLFY